MMCLKSFDRVFADSSESQQGLAIVRRKAFQTKLSRQLHRGISPAPVTRLMLLIGVVDKIAQQYTANRNWQVWQRIDE